VSAKPQPHQNDATVVEGQHFDAAASPHFRFSSFFGSTRLENTPGRIRTSDRRIRNPMLYPAELRALVAAILCTNVLKQPAEEAKLLDRRVDETAGSQMKLRGGD
jgi:hypothetical protein